MARAAAPRSRAALAGLRAGLVAPRDRGFPRAEDRAASSCCSSARGGGWRTCCEETAMAIVEPNASASRTCSMPSPPDAGRRRCDAELRSHVDGCGICQDVARSLRRRCPTSATPPGTTSPCRRRASSGGARRFARARKPGGGRRAPIAVAQVVAVACLIGAALSLVPFALAAIEAGRRLPRIGRGVVDAARRGCVDAFTLVTGTALPILPFAVASILLDADPAVLRAHRGIAPEPATRYLRNSQRGVRTVRRAAFAS